MAGVQISREAMLRRIARFKELRPMDYKALGMAEVPEGMEGFMVIAPGGMAPISDAQDFNLGVVKADPGKGAPLHSHKTVEVFVPLSGRWAFFWGEAGEEEVTLEAWDTISFPPGVPHGFRNLGSEKACLLAVVGGSQAIEVEYASQEAKRG